MCIETSNINTVCVLKEYFIHHYTLIMKTLDTIIDIMTKMIEPIMLIVIGTIVLILAAALYLPLFASYMGM